MARVHQTNIHIPLIIHAPGVAAGRTKTPVSGIDIGPTLLALAGLSKANGMLGMNLLDSSLPFSRTRVVETYGGAVPNVPGAKAILAERRPMRQSVLLDGWKLILNGNEAELYYLPNDPMEEHDLARNDPGRIEPLRALIKQWNKATHSQPDTTGETLSPDDLQALESLGYIK